MKVAVPGPARASWEGEEKSAVYFGNEVQGGPAGDTEWQENKRRALGDRGGRQDSLQRPEMNVPSPCVPTPLASQLAPLGTEDTVRGQAPRAVPQGLPPALRFESAGTLTPALGGG